MKKVWMILALGVIAIMTQTLDLNGENQPRNDATPAQQETNTSDNLLQQAFEHRRSDLQVRGNGFVVKVLSDDMKGSRHQRFLLRLSHGQVLLIAHNIDLAPRIEKLHKGDPVEFYGEYEWNDKGGVIHWTHRDPGNEHIDGWLKHKGRTYQ